MVQDGLTKPASKFFFAKNDIRMNRSLIHKDDIGIVESKLKDIYSIYLITIDERLNLITNDFVKFFELFDITSTGDAFPKKVCNVCHRLLNTTEFARNQNAKGDRPVRRPSCNECRVKIDGVGLLLEDKRKWERTRPELVPFLCPICLKRTIPGLTSNIVIDHDHNTGRARAWICDSCNTGLGRFKDNVEILKELLTIWKQSKRRVIFF